MTIRLGNKIISGGGSSGVPGWTGTLAEYNALTEIDDEMLYYITDDCLDSNSNHLGGLDIGDIGFTALGVNEELNCRRYLNGQVLAMDEFPEFTSKLKHAVSLNSSIAVDEDIWQTELAMSANGICYKFVIDDNNMTIRLPKYPEYFIAGLSDNTGVAGNGMTLGLTDGTNTFATRMSSSGLTDGTGVGSPVGSSSDGINTLSSVTIGLSTDATKSGLEALVDSASEKVYGFYFIQVANGLEQTVDITREITLNNPFFLGMYQYFEVEPNNISWLKSEGQWNSAEVYPGMWEWLVENTENGAEGFLNKTMYAFSDAGTTNSWWVITTETPQVGQMVYTSGMIPRGPITSVTETGFVYTNNHSGTTYTTTRNSEKDITDVYQYESTADYDFIIDKDTNTFRLPIEVKGAAGKAVVGNGLGLGITNGKNSGVWGDFANNMISTNPVGQPVGTSLGWASTNTTAIGVITDPNYSGIETSTEGLHLYFYVGETVQDPTLINVGRITHALSLKTDMGQAAHAGMPSGKYVDMTLGASLSSYVAPADGWVCLNRTSTGAGQFLTLASNSYIGFRNYVHASGHSPMVTIPVKKGETFTVEYTTAGTINRFRFIYANGSAPTN